jgi:polyphosphate kinase 2 (PPK2 family)
VFGQCCGLRQRIGSLTHIAGVRHSVACVVVYGEAETGPLATARGKPWCRFKWDDVDPDDKGPFDNEAAALNETEAFIRKLDPLQERLYAEGKRGLLIVLQGVDTAGKDGTIRHVMRGVNPQGCRVTSFKDPCP